MSSLTIGTGIHNPRAISDSLAFDTTGVNVVICGLTPHQLDGLIAAAAEARDAYLSDLDDVCGCNGGDLPLFDHDRLCPRRLLAEYRGVDA